MDLSVLTLSPALIFTRTLAAVERHYAELSHIAFSDAKIFVRTLEDVEGHYTELSHVSFSDAKIFNRSLDSVTRHYAELSYISFEMANLFSRYMVVFDPNDDVGVLLSANLDSPPIIPVVRYRPIPIIYMKGKK